MRKLLIGLAALGVLALAPAAQAGCVSEGGGTGYLAFAPSLNAPHWDGAGAIHCTTNNGDFYQLRLYFETNSGGSYHIVTHAFIVQYAPPGPLPNNFYDARHFKWACSDVEDVQPFFVGIRVRAVVENLNTGSLSVHWGPAANAGTHANCNGSTSNPLIQRMSVLVPGGPTRIS